MIKRFDSQVIMGENENKIFKFFIGSKIITFAVDTKNEHIFLFTLTHLIFCSYLDRTVEQSFSRKYKNLLIVEKNHSHYSGGIVYTIASRVRFKSNKLYLENMITKCQIKDTILFTSFRTN